MVRRRGSYRQLWACKLFTCFGGKALGLGSLTGAEKGTQWSMGARSPGVFSQSLTLAPRLRSVPGGAARREDSPSLAGDREATSGVRASFPPGAVGGDRRPVPQGVTEVQSG